MRVSQGKVLSFFKTLCSSEKCALKTDKKVTRAQAKGKWEAPKTLASEAKVRLTSTSSGLLFPFKQQQEQGVCAHKCIKVLTLTS